MNLSTYFFRDFDPMKDKVPNDYFDQLPQIFKRARRLLKGRTSQEICEAIQIIDWIVDKKLKYKTLKEKKTMHSTNIIPTLSIFQETYLEYDLENHSLFPNATNEEYFAAIALSEGYQAIDYSGKKGPLAKALHKKDTAIIAGNHAVTAMEAICFAEHLANKEFQINFTKSAIKIKKMRDTQYAAIKRHTGTKMLKKEALRLYQEGSYTSARHATQVIYPKLADYANKISIPCISKKNIDSDGIHRTIYRWLLEFKKLSKK